MDVEIERLILDFRTISGYTETEAARIVRRCIRLAKASDGDLNTWLGNVYKIARFGNAQFDNDFEAWLERMEKHWKAVK